MTTRNVVILIAGIALVLISFIVGRNSKKCPNIDSVVYHDTVIIQTPITSQPQLSHPINVINADITKKHQKKTTPGGVATITTTAQTTAPASTVVSKIGFKQIDTLKWKNIWVSVSDTGNCDGVINREYIFGGHTESSVVTRTNNYVLPPPLFQLNAGVQTLFSTNGFKLVDVAPVLSLDYKHKHMASLAYGIETKQLIIGIQTKIK